MSKLPQGKPIMQDAPPEVQKLFADIWRGVQKTERELESKRVKENPVKHRLTLVMEGHTGYTYFPAGKNGRGSTVRFCVSTNRNVAGYFLIWREVSMEKKTVRDQWDSTISKQSALRCAKRLAQEYKDKQ